MKENKRELPIGEARTLEAGKHVLPAIEVANSVKWVNHDMELPFDLKEGEPTKLGLFLTSKINSGGINIEVSQKHGRSGILGRIFFRDKQGNLYRDVDVKGIGLVKLNPMAFSGNESLYIVGKMKPRIADSISGIEERTEGVANLEDGQKDVALSELFFQNNIRVVRSIALIELHEVVDENGDIMSVESAKKLGFISKDSTPALEVRAFVTKARVADCGDFGRDTILKDARLLVAAELNIRPEDFSDKDYLTWFSNTLAEEVGKMHRSGYFHGYLTPHNFTLDCRLLDFDSVMKFGDITLAIAEKLRSRMMNGIFGFDIKAMNNQDVARAYDFSRAYTTIFAEFVDNFGLKDSDDGEEFLSKLSDSFINTYEKASREKLKMEHF